ncbi:TonB-dependent receptor [Novosphingobium profundi]|uniref:TonB-dependent receptor n=1 Tax=Novosphingobium profundi TaxID=1774954 RepID=UPI001BDAA7BD|nr:TonB-dependent receptor [Novosphingobium profundi]MBT0667964.1 TonB-dependent receptor [Novosphingobium profundi]
MNRNSRTASGKLAGLLAATGLSTLALASQAHAQGAEDTQPTVIGADIVVTALKRATSIQETPISISAVTGETMANSGVQSIADLAATTPGLSFVDGGPSQRRVVIRGIQGAGEPMIGTYYDETPVTGMIGASNDAGGSTPELKLFDVERVEVLRGPQGTLYGAGSMGGTLRVIYKKPDLTTYASAIDANLSNTHEGGWNYDASAMVNLPLATDKVALRVVGFYRHQDGYIDNTALGIDDINSLESYGGRFTLRMKPSDRWTFDVSAFVNHAETDTTSWTLDAGTYNSDAYARQPVKDDTQLYSLTSNYEFDFATLVASGSYMHRQLDTASDVSRYIQAQRTTSRCATLVGGGSACSADQLSDYYDLVDYQSYSVLYPQQEMDAWTGELRLSSNTKGLIDWTVGGFWSNRNIAVWNPQVNTDATTGEIIRPLEVDTGRHIDDTLTQLAGYGEVTVHPFAGFQLTGGARYFHYKKDIVGYTDVASILVGAKITPATEVNSNENGWVFRFNGSYEITPDLMFYAEAAQGYRPGGANQVLGLDAALTAYNSDSLWNYEAGFKTSWFNRAVLFNIDAYWIDWSDMQITLRTPNGAFSYLGNAGKATVKGIEAELNAMPVEGLSLQGNVTYTDATLAEDQNTGVTATSGLKGDRIPYVAKWMGGASAQYDWALSDTLGAMARVDFNYVGRSWSDFRHTYAYAREVDSYELVNARVGVEGPGKEWGAYLFVTNLFDATAITRASSSAIAQGRTLVTSATPRTIGVNLRHNF